MPSDDPPRAEAPADRATLVAGAPRPEGGDDDLGMLLAPEVEAAGLDRASRGSARSTIPWPNRPCVAGPLGAATDFGKYEILCELGRGGMGVVYKARQKDLDRIVAIKMILSSHLAAPDHVERFYAEARAAAQIQDRHVVAIHDVGQEAGQHYFAMEYVSGPSLAALIGDGPIDPEAAARLVMIVARAIDRLHGRGVVHRDLKPSNILLDAAGEPCVTDFGLAKMLAADGHMTRTGAIVGTPSYMAPEQAAGKAGEVGPLSDVYALGAILYELLTGRPPFDEANPLDTLVQVLEGEPAAPQELRPAIPRDLARIALKCLEKSPGLRYPSAADLADDLARYLRGEPVEARRQSIPQRVGRWARREPALASRLSILALCAAIVEADQKLLHALQPADYRPIMLALGLGLFASLVFQALLRYGRWTNLARYTWAAADMSLFTTLVATNDALGTPLVAGYFLLVTASGLWFREWLVGFTTAAAVASYAGLAAVEARVLRAATGMPRHVLFMAGLIVAGVIIAYQVKRVRALSFYYEHRPLP